MRKSAIKFPKVLPKLIVFDLDQTLWPWGVDDFIFKPPYQKQKKNGKEVVVDSCGRIMDPFKDTSIILATLHANNIDIAAASRSTYPAGANQLLDLFDWRKYFKYIEIFPGCKVNHFQRFKEQSGLMYEKMLFFDNEYRNIADVSKLGVTSILVDSSKGCTVEDFNLGLQKFAGDLNNNI